MNRRDTCTGVIRINPKRYTDAFIDDPDEGPDIFVTSRGDALEGDLVEVAFNDKSLWKLKYEVIINKWDEWSEHIMPVISIVEAKIKNGSSDIVESNFNLPSNMPSGLLKLRVEDILDLPFSSRIIQKTGSVINVIKKNSAGVAGGFLRPFSNSQALFSPLDSRIPRMLINIDQCPLDFTSRPNTYSNTLFVARIIEWDSSKSYANGELIKIVGNSNKIEARIETALLENQIDDSDFPDDVYEELEYLNHLGPRWFEENSKDRRDLTNHCIFTIDPKTARDLDDAVSIRALGDGFFEVGVHIADVSFFVREMSAVDYHARLRTTSVYLVDRVIPMLPRILCERMCSLNPGETKLTFSVIWKLDEDGKIHDKWFGRTVIKPCVKLAYEQAQHLIDCDEIAWIKEDINMPQLHNFTWEQIEKSVKQLNKIAKNLKHERFEGGALRIEQVKLKYELDPDSGFPIGFEFEERGDSNHLIEEFMLLANMSVAKRLYEHSKETAFLRRHPSSPAHLLKDVKEFCDAKGLKIDITNSKGIQKSLNDITDLTIAKVVSHLLLKSMKNAEYICTGNMNDAQGFSHYALNVPFYTHFTSPIRRYADLVVHRQLSIALGYEKMSYEDVDSLSMVASACTTRKNSSKIISDISQKLYFNLFVQQAGFCELTACVTKIYDNSFDVILVEYDRSARVYLERLKPQLIGQKFQSFAGNKSLELIWNLDLVRSDTNKVKVRRIRGRGGRKKREADANLEYRSELESAQMLQKHSELDKCVNNRTAEKQLIQVFDLIRVIVSANKNDISQLIVDLKMPGQ